MNNSPQNAKGCPLSNPQAEPNPPDEPNEDFAHKDDLLDEALRETFPASDPMSSERFR